LSLNKPLVSYPYVDEDFRLKSSKEGGEMMNPTDALGLCLGFSIFKTKMPGAPNTITLTLIDEELEFPYPPIIFMLQLDGTLKWL